jgi:CDGSH-type Zn-finger protein
MLAAARTRTLAAAATSGGRRAMVVRASAAPAGGVINPSIRKSEEKVVDVLPCAAAGGKVRARRRGHGSRTERLMRVWRLCVRGASALQTVRAANRPRRRRPRTTCTAPQVVVCRCWRSTKFPLCDGAHVAHNKATGDNVGPCLVEGPKQ